MNKQKGFTLIELLVVISIISLLSSVVFSSLSSARQKGNVAAGEQLSGQLLRSSSLENGVIIYQFDDPSGTVAIDDSSNGKNGTLVGSPARVSSYKSSGYALDFSGGGKYVSIPSFSLPPLMTFSAWVKTTSPGAAMAILTMQASLCTWSVSFSVDVGLPSLQYYGGGSYANKRVDDGAWHHIAATLIAEPTDPNFGKYVFYVDGKRDAEGDRDPYTTSNCITQTKTGYIGSQVGASYVFTGAIDDVMVFNKILLASEVQKLYAQGVVQHSLAAK